MGNEKSLTKNSIIYAIKTIIGLLFPIITFPYITHVLSADSIGKVNFSASIISYFSLIAGLGIYTVAVKEGAGIREDKNKISLYCSEMFSFNLITTFISYALFIIMLIINKKWHDYAVIMFIISMTIPLTTLGVEWICTIYEDYFFITVRTIIMQLVSVVFLFAFVRTANDVYYYAVYSVLVSVGSNIFNFFRARRFVQLKVILSHKLTRFIKPTTLLFSIVVANQIYINSDITILGYMTTDTQVGLYNASVKLYNIVKMLLLSIGTVGLPRLAYLVGNYNQQKYEHEFKKIFRIITFFTLPAALGLFVVGKDVMIVYAGSDYAVSGTYLRILSLAIPFSVMGSYFASSCLVLQGKEKQILFSAVVGALLNIILNLIFIPIYGAVVAPITTLISEMVTALIHAINIRRIHTLHISILQDLDWKTLLSALVMTLGTYEIAARINLIVLRIIVTVISGFTIYFASNLIFRNQTLFLLLSKFLKRKG